jgi:hypothetical protein
MLSVVFSVTDINLDFFIFRVDSSERTTSVILGVAGLGLSIITFLSPQIRIPAALTLVVFLTTLFLVLRLQQLSDELASLGRGQKRINSEISRMKERFDIYKKIYKLEEDMRLLKMGKKGAWNPIWGIAIIAILVLLFFILKAAGLF